MSIDIQHRKRKNKKTILKWFPNYGQPAAGQRLEKKFKLQGAILWRKKQL